MDLTNTTGSEIFIGDPSIRKDGLRIPAGGTVTVSDIVRQNETVSALITAGDLTVSNLQSTADSPVVQEEIDAALLTVDGLSLTQAILSWTPGDTSVLSVAALTPPAGKFTIMRWTCRPAPGGIYEHVSSGWAIVGDDTSLTTRGVTTARNGGPNEVEGLNPEGGPATLAKDLSGNVFTASMSYNVSTKRIEVTPTVNTIAGGAGALEMDNIIWTPSGAS